MGVLVERVGDSVEGLEDADEEARFDGSNGRNTTAVYSYSSFLFFRTTKLLECAYERRVGTSQCRATEEFV